MIDFMPLPLRAVRDRPRGASSRRRPEKRLGTDEQWDRAEHALRVRAASGTGVPYEISPGEGTFYGPKIDLHMTDVLGRSWQMRDDPARLPDARPVRPRRTWARTTRALAGRDSPRAPRLARALHGHPDRALRRRVPVLAGAGAGARDSRRGVASHVGGRAPRPSRGRGLPRRGRRARRARSASASATPSSRRCRSSSCTATASRTLRWPYVGAAASSRLTRSPCCLARFAELAAEADPG